MTKLGILYDNISGNTGDTAVGISVRQILTDLGVDFDELVIGRFHPADYQTIIVGGGALIRHSPDWLYDKFRVPGPHILNCCGIVGTPDDLHYLNDYLYVSVRSLGDKQKLSYLDREVKAVPCTTMLLNDSKDPMVTIRSPSLGIHMAQGVVNEDELVSLLARLRFNVYLVPITPYNHDFKYLALLHERLANSTLLPLLRPEELFTTIGKFDYFISVSLHGAIFAYVHNVPFCLWNGGDKFRFFMEERQLGDFLFHDVQQLDAAVSSLLHHRPDYSSSIADDMARLDEHIQTIKQLLPAACFVGTAVPQDNNAPLTIQQLQSRLLESDMHIYYLRQQIDDLQHKLTGRHKAAALQGGHARSSEGWQPMLARLFPRIRGWHQCYQIAIAGLKILISQGPVNFCRRLVRWLNNG